MSLTSQSIKDHIIEHEILGVTAGGGGGGPGVDDRYFSLGASRDRLVTTNIYLRTHDNIPTNVSPIILPFNSTLIAISASCSSASTWVAEVHLAGSLVTGAILNIAAAVKAYRNDLTIDFNAGDGVQIYCNGTGVPFPNVDLIFRRR
jgi:hypothetical protein